MIWPPGIILARKPLVFNGPNLGEGYNFKIVSDFDFRLIHLEIRKGKASDIFTGGVHAAESETFKRQTKT
jgi:hypothetical protein